MNRVYGRLMEIETDNAIFRYPERCIDLNLTRDVFIEPDTGIVTIYNLSPDTIKQFRAGAPIQIRTGYNGNLGVLFSGSIEKVYTDRGFMKDIETKLLVVDGSVSSLRLDINIPSYGWRSVKRIIYDIMTRASLPVIFSDDIPDKAYFSYSVSGCVQEVLEPILKDLDVVGHIIDNKMVIHPVNTPIFNILEIKPETGLLTRPHPISCAETGEEGYEIQTLLYHQIKPAGIINLKSRFLSGMFTIRRANYKVSDSDFICNMEVYPYG